MMVKITNPLCISRLRESHLTNTEVVERALCKRMRIKPRLFREKTRGANKQVSNPNCIPIKITDSRIRNYVMLQKRQKGICRRHTVESAMLDEMNGGKEA